LRPVWLTCGSQPSLRRRSNPSHATQSQPGACRAAAAATRCRRLPPLQQRGTPHAASCPPTPPLQEEVWDLNQKIDTGKLIDSAGAGRSMFSPGWLTQLNQLWGGKSVSCQRLLTPALSCPYMHAFMNRTSCRLRAAACGRMPAGVSGRALRYANHRCKPPPLHHPRPAPPTHPAPLPCCRTCPWPTPSQTTSRTCWAGPCSRRCSSGWWSLGPSTCCPQARRCACCAGVLCRPVMCTLHLHISLCCGAAVAGAAV
jgi:hypothetical protein